MHLIARREIILFMVASIVLAVPVINHEPRESIDKTDNSKQKTAFEPETGEQPVVLQRQSGANIEKRKQNPELDGLDTALDVDKREFIANTKTRNPAAKLDGLYMMSRFGPDEEPAGIRQKLADKLDGLYMDFKSTDEEPVITRRQLAAKLDGLYMMIWHSSDDEPDDIVTS